ACAEVLSGASATTAKRTSFCQSPTLFSGGLYAEPCCRVSSVIFGRPNDFKFCVVASHQHRNRCWGGDRSIECCGAKCKCHPYRCLYWHFANCQYKRER